MSNTIEAKPTNASDMVDIQSSRDNRAIHIDKVGIKDIRHPVRIKDRSVGEQHTIATFNMYVNLPHNFKGTHMSRFVEILHLFRPEVRPFLLFHQLKTHLLPLLFLKGFYMKDSGLSRDVPS